MIRNIRHKFGAIRCETDDIKFPSKLERNYYLKLKLLQKSGEVIFFIRQPPFDIGGGAKYLADFMVFWKDGTVTIVDCKGKDTPMSILKRKQVEALYPIEIEIVTKV